MTEQELNNLLDQGEGLRIEFKESQIAMPSTLFETVSSFLNKDGGTILLGVNDQGRITGIDPNRIEQIIKDIVTSSNNPDVLNPPFTLNPIKFDRSELSLLYINIPASSQVHKCRNDVYDRENDIDLRITDNVRLNEIYFRKRQSFTESKIYPALRYEDFNERVFEKVRKLIKSRKPDHLWLKEDNLSLLRSANFYRRDYQSGDEGYTLAAAIVFGKDNVIQSILPAYKIDVLVRREDIDRWDDRFTSRTNLIDAYDDVMTFVVKHLKDQFYLEGDQRRDLRTIIFREVVANIIVHREYTNASPTQFIIYKDRVEVTNPNKAQFHGPLTLDSFSPFSKNPIIAKFFTELGRVDEIGSGLRNVNKYLPHYSGGARPVFIEDDIFKTILPLVSNKLQPKLQLLLNYFGIAKEHLSSNSLNVLNYLDIEPQIAKHFEDDPSFLFHLISRYIQNGKKLDSLELLNPKEFRLFETWTKLNFEVITLHPQIESGGRQEEVGYKSDKSNVLKMKNFKAIPSVEGISSLQKGYKLPGKRLGIFLKILLYASSTQTVDQLCSFMEYKSLPQFKSRYLLLLLKLNLIQYTIPDKPTSPDQKYVLTEKGKLFLGGFDI